MPDRIEDIVIVGGGPAALFTALSLRRVNEDVDLTIIRPEEKPGRWPNRGSFNAIHSFLHDFLGIDRGWFMKEVRPVWKLSGFFLDWAGHPPFHHELDLDSVYRMDNTLDTPAASRLHYEKRGITLSNALYDHKKTPFIEYEDGIQQHPGVAYHFDKQRLLDALESLAEDRGIRIDDGMVTDRDMNETKGRVHEVYTATDSYSADLFVSATGGRDLLCSQRAEWRKLPTPVNSAIEGEFAIDPVEVTPATVFDTGEAGWFWEIDTPDRRSRGYVYNDKFLSEEEATEEFKQRVSRRMDPEVMRHHSFESQYRPRPWIENVVAMGTAQGFIEPLEATMTTGTAILAKKFARHLNACHFRPTNTNRSQFNTTCQSFWLSVSDYLMIHYKFNDANTDFWNDVGNMPLPKRPLGIVETFWGGGLIKSGSAKEALNCHDIDFHMVGPTNYANLLRGLGETPRVDGVDEYSEEDAQVVKDRISQHRNQANLAISYDELYDERLDEVADQLS